MKDFLGFSLHTHYIIQHIQDVMKYKKKKRNKRTNEDIRARPIARIDFRGVQDPQKVDFLNLTLLKPPTKTPFCG